MWNGKNKAVTFSYDDGVVQDFRLVALFNRYGLKSTFNINSELLGLKEVLVRSGVDVCHDKIRPSELKELYKGHEVAVHTLTHPNLTVLDEAEIIRQGEEDRKNLEKLAGYEIIGMAYPCGGVNNDDRVAEIPEMLQCSQEFVIVPLVQPDAGLVENVGDAHQPGADLCREADALGLAAGKGPCGAAQGQIVQANVDQEADPVPDLLQDLSAHKLLIVRQLHSLQEIQKLLDGHLGDLVNILIRNGHRQGFLFQSPSAALCAVEAPLSIVSAIAASYSA